MSLRNRPVGRTLRWIGRFALCGVLVSVPASATAQSVPEDFVVTLKRWCSADCPNYTVSVDARGNVTYEGHEFARVLGRKTSSVEYSAVVALFEAVERIGFFELKDEYIFIPLPNGTKLFVTHTEGDADVTVTANGRTKRIRDHLNAPASLTDLERQIDRVTRISQWTEVKDPKVRQLIDAGWTASDEDLAVLLRNALEADDVAELAEVIEAGANPNTTYAEERLTALMLARSAAAVRILLDAGANPSAKSTGGVTPLAVATSLDPEITALLLKAGVVVDESHDADGRTALWQAACVGNAGAVRLLLNAGANPHMRAAGLTPAECARNRRRARQEHSSALPGTRGYKRPFAEDIDRTIALLDEAVASSRRRD